jgi:hypothetical protein
MVGSHDAAAGLPTFFSGVSIDSLTTAVSSSRIDSTIAADKRKQTKKIPFWRRWNIAPHLSQQAAQYNLSSSAMAIFIMKMDVYTPEPS